MPEKYWAICPNCGADIDYSSFTYDDTMRMQFTLMARASVPTVARNGSGKRSLFFLRFVSSKRFEKKRTIEILTFVRMYDII